MKPTKATIRSYQVGFGDCFLLTFHYKDGSKRHVLIDCGSTSPPKNSRNFSMLKVAEQIKHDCGGKLAAVVATHRHKDHISGFDPGAKNKGPGAVIRALTPELVLQPWTENPKLPTDANSPAAKKKAAKGVLGLRSVQYALGLQAMHRFAKGLLHEVISLRPAVSKRVADQLQFLGDDNLHNAAAVKNLMGMGKKREYLYYRAKTSLGKHLPGVTVTVLGPPTVKQNSNIEKQRREDAAEFWHLRAAATRSGHAGAPSPFARRHHLPRSDWPAEANWLIPRVQAARAAQLLSLVRMLDDAMNNTSLILLFQFNRKTLLFPGDAQIENWEHALRDAPDAAANRRLLKKTDFYKVGHHGSLNATPHTLWNLFARKGPQGQAGRLQSMMSTRSGKHGSSASGTEVPRSKLVTALKKESALKDTQTIRKKDGLCHVVEIM